MIGYLHACRPGRMALVYDLMEPLRPHVDRLILGFVHSHTFSPDDFVLAENGVCRLHPQGMWWLCRAWRARDELPDRGVLIARTFEQISYNPVRCEQDSPPCQTFPKAARSRGASLSR